MAVYLLLPLPAISPRPEAICVTIFFAKFFTYASILFIGFSWIALHVANATTLGIARLYMSFLLSVKSYRQRYMQALLPTTNHYYHNRIFSKSLFGIDTNSPLVTILGFSRRRARVTQYVCPPSL